MKKLFVFLIVICLIPLGCKKKQEELAKEKALIKNQRVEALRNLKSVDIEAYIIAYVFKNQEKAIGSIPVVKIPARTSFIFVYKEKEYSFTLKNDIWGIQDGEKILMRAGYIKNSPLFEFIPAIIEKPQKWWTKKELEPWIRKYPLTPVQYEEGINYPTFYNLECFERTAATGAKNIYLKDGPTLQTLCGNIFLFFNSNYEPWKIRPNYKK